MTKDENARHVFIGLDALRGCAAVAVLLFHSRYAIGIPWLMPGGYLAVDLFFVMSGFVVAHAYDHRMASLGFRGFMSIRVVRFYPLYATGLILGVMRAVALARLGSSELPGFELYLAIAAGLLFLPFPALEPSLSISPLNSPGWSLLFEVWMNAAYSGLRFWRSPLVLILIMLASAVFIVLKADPTGGPHWRDILGGAARIGYSFPLGVLIYRYRSFVPTSLVKFGWAAVPISLAFFMINPTPALSKYFIIIVSPMIVILGSLCIFKVKVFEVISNFLGRGSYCVYVIHHPILLLTIGIAGRLKIPIALAVLFALFSIVLSAPFIDRYFDEPARRVLRSLAPRRHSSTSVPRL